MKKRGEQAKRLKPFEGNVERSRHRDGQSHTHMDKHALSHSEIKGQVLKYTQIDEMVMDSSAPLYSSQPCLIVYLLVCARS